LSARITIASGLIRNESGPMAKIKVIYIDQTCGMVDDSCLKGLIAKGEIVAYCGPAGWSGVKNKEMPGETDEQKVAEEREVSI
jgi:hypothetical protein